MKRHMQQKPKWGKDNLKIGELQKIDENAYSFWITIDAKNRAAKKIEKQYQSLSNG